MNLQKGEGSPDWHFLSQKVKRSAYITELILHCKSTLSGSAQFVQNTSQKNIISHPLHPGGHQAQHGGVRLRGAKVGPHGTRTGGKTTNGQTSGEKRQRRTHLLIAAGNSMRRRQAQRCHHQPVCLTAVLFNFFYNSRERDRWC